MDAAPNLFTDGKAYERLMGRWSKRVGEQFLDWIGAAKGLRWIDVGCGNGAFTAALIARCQPAAVTGIDPSEGQLGFARTRPDARLAEFHVGDAQALPFEDDSFDAAAMALAIAFIPDPLKAVREMARVVKPGGVVATYMWDFAASSYPLSPLANAMRSLGFDLKQPPSRDAARPENLLAIWRQAGLQAVEATAIRIGVAYDSFDDFWVSNSAPIGVSGKAASELPPDKREAVKALLRKTLPIDSDGRIAYDAFANAVKGRVPS